MLLVSYALLMFSTSLLAAAALAPKDRYHRSRRSSRTSYKITGSGDNEVGDDGAKCG